MLPISLVMIVRNEEDVIEDCLRSVGGMVSQIVVVDTGSTDNTLKIASNYSAEIHHYAWHEDFASARNFGLAKANQPWILSLDADERIESWNKPELENMLQEKTVWSLRSIHEFHRGDQLLEQIVYQPRLFPNHQDYRFFGRIHEELLFRRQPVLMKRTEITFRHLGYRKERIQKKDKILRNVEVHLLEHEQDPINPKHLFRAAKTCFHAQNYDLAKDLYEKVMDLEINDKQMFATLLIDYGYVCQQCNATEQALPILLDNSEPVKDCPEIWYVLGLLFLSRKTIEDVYRAADCFHMCLEVGENQHEYTHTVGAGSFLAYYNLGLIYQALGDSRAEECFGKAAEYGYEFDRITIKR